MPRRSAYDRQVLSALARRQHGVVTRQQALACGMSARAVSYRHRDGGPWRAVLPGVYLTHTGEPTLDQRDMAALLYAGPRSVLTGAASLRRHRMPNLRLDTVDVLVPAVCGRQSAGFVRVRRTARMPSPFCVAGEIRYALPGRAVADAVLGLADIREVRALVAAAVQRGICPVPLLTAELDAGPVRGSALFRRALAEVADGVRSVAEADLRDLIRRAGLPVPLFNPRLYAGGKFLAMPDCWWPQAGVAVEVDSREWHLSPRSWERTLARHARMSACGIIVLHFTPRQIRAERGAVVASIRSALDSAGSRPLPSIRTAPC